MAVQWQQLDDQPRLLMEAQLRPIQGTRFQPTGFPDLGAAVYNAPGGGGQIVLVESAQSVANRLESVCWDEANDRPHSALSGMPYVSVELWGSGKTTNSMLEAHRLNSPYIMRDEDFKEQFRVAAGLPAKESGAGVFDRRKLASAAFRYDPSSVLHGVFLEKIAGVARLQRCVSGFVEAREANVADSGGVKNDRVAPAPSALTAIGLTVGAAEGFGNVPFHRTEYTAEAITAYFNLDLAQITPPPTRWQRDHPPKRWTGPIASRSGWTASSRPSTWTASPTTIAASTAMNMSGSQRDLPWAARSSPHAACPAAARATSKTAK